MDQSTIKSEEAGLAARMRNFLWAGIGFVSLGLGILGAFLPVMPTTIFLIIACWAFAKSCPVIHDKLMNHPKYGPSLTLWFEHGVIPRRSKIFAVGLILVSYALSLLIIKQLWVAGLVGLTLTLVSTFLVTRPEAPKG